MPRLFLPRGARRARWGLLILLLMLVYDGRSGTTVTGAPLPDQTNCTVKGRPGEPSPNPSLVGEEITVLLTAGWSLADAHTNAECLVLAPIWLWRVMKTERFDPVSGSFVTSMNYTPPPPNQPIPTSPRATLKARFPEAGRWRVTLKVLATWSSVNCGDCTADDPNVVIEFNVSPCTFAGELKPNDKFDFRSYSRVGLGEQGRLFTRPGPGLTLDDLKPLTWRIISGGEHIALPAFDANEDTGEGGFVAFKNPGQAVLGLKSGKTGCESTLTVDVVAPNGVKHRYDHEWADSGIVIDEISFGIENFVDFQPTDVSFAALEAFEGESAGTAVGGIPRENHERNGPHEVRSGNITNGSGWVMFDVPKANPFRIGWDPGSMTWRIPQQYWDDTATLQQIVVLEQRFDFDGRRWIRIRKGGVDKTGPTLP